MYVEELLQRTGAAVTSVCLKDTEGSTQQHRDGRFPGMQSSLSLLTFNLEDAHCLSVSSSMSLCVGLSLSLFLPVSLSISVSPSLSLSLSLCLFLSLTLCLSLCLSLSLSLSFPPYALSLIWTMILRTVIVSNDSVF